jgi:hypothetical protein
MSRLCLILLSVFTVALSLSEPRRAMYLLDTSDATYTACSLPGLRRYAAAYGWPLHELTASIVRGRQEARHRATERLSLQRDTRASVRDELDVDGHFAKLHVFADALERGYDEILYIDIDVVLNERVDLPSVFQHAALPRDEPAVALYGQGVPKEAIFEAILRINPRLRRRVQRESVNYWNTGVVVINRAAMQLLKTLVETLYAAYVARGLRVADLPFFDQGFVNAVLWDVALGVGVRPLSFAWNASHSKYFYHHGDRFWLREPAYANKTFVPFVFHFMGCAGRNQTLEDGEECKYKRMREFAREHLDMAC